MPIPKPKDGEEKQDFISRCMGDEVMNAEYEDQDQRAAVCYDIWKRAKGEKKESDMTIERRICPETEIRAVGEGDAKKLEGYAARFNSLSQEMWGFKERINPGAFKRSIDAGADVRALLNHDPNYVLGRTIAKTLEVSEDDKGLRVLITPPNTQWAKDLMETISRGDISQMSFGFRVVTDKWETKDEDNIRTLVDVDLIDVSPVTFPAYTETEIYTRSLPAVDGLDFAKIAKVIVRAEHKLPLDDNDRAILHRSVETLNNLAIDVGDISDGQAGDDKADEIIQKALALVTVRRRLLSLRDRNL